MQLDQQICCEDFQDLVVRSEMKERSRREATRGRMLGRYQANATENHRQSYPIGKPQGSTRLTAGNMIK